ncbi:MAG: hypothetical protein OXF74_07270 [Rhodobacteraceae bacterium]|nr:hypothetical protein [Paracoccaceae bacterium]
MKHESGSRPPATLNDVYRVLGEIHETLLRMQNASSPPSRRMEDPGHWMDRFTPRELTQFNSDWRFSMSWKAAYPDDDAGFIEDLVKACCERAWADGSWFIGGRKALTRAVAVRVATWPHQDINTWLDDLEQKHELHRELKYIDDDCISDSRLRDICERFCTNAWMDEQLRYSPEEMEAALAPRVRAWFTRDAL